MATAAELGSRLAVWNAVMATRGKRVVLPRCCRYERRPSSLRQRGRRLRTPAPEGRACRPRAAVRRDSPRGSAFRSWSRMTGAWFRADSVPDRFGFKVAALEPDTLDHQQILDEVVGILARWKGGVEDETVIAAWTGKGSNALAERVHVRAPLDRGNGRRSSAQRRPAHPQTAPTSASSISAASRAIALAARARLREQRAILPRELVRLAVGDRHSDRLQLFSECQINWRGR